jgi:hypothetical protein
LWRLRWDVSGQANQVKRPQIVIVQASPEAIERDSLAVVHVTLRRIIAKDPVDQDSLLMFVKPSIFAAKPALRLANARWHKEPRRDANTGGDSSFNQKEP